MSTEYGFVDDKKQESWNGFLNKAMALASEMESAIRGIPVDPALTEKKDNCIESLNLFIKNLPNSLDCDDIFWKDIGTCTAKKFYWANQHGIHDIPSLRQYASQHPELSIKDEYGEPILLEKLIEIIEARTH